MMSHDLQSDMQKPLKEAMNHLRHKKWRSASTILDMILQAEPDCVAAKAGEIMVKYHIPTIDAISECKQDITTEEQEILTAAFADTQADMASILDHYRVNMLSVHDKAKERAYKKAKRKAKSCHFIPVRTDHGLYILKSFPKIQDCKRQFESIREYKDSEQCAELCALTHELISKADPFVSFGKIDIKLSVFKFFGLPCLLYVLFSWIPVFHYNFQLFTAPFQTLKQYFSAIFSNGTSEPPSAFIITSIVITAVLSVLLALYLFSRTVIELFFNIIEVIADNFDDPAGLFYIPLLIAILLSPFAFVFLSPIVSLIFLIYICLRILKRHRLIKNFTACNTELIQRMKVLSKQCSMLNPKRILRELL